MSVSLLSFPTELQAYQEWLKNAPGGTLWQSLEWESYQRALGRETRLYGVKKVSGTLVKVPDTFFDATALVIIDRTSFGLSTWDIPRGPLFADAEAAQGLLQHLEGEARKDRCMALYCSPPSQIPATCNPQPTTSSRGEQPEATVILDLTLSDEELLRKMHEKGRYNIRVAQKHGVRAGESVDMGAFYELLRKTARRDRFRVLPYRNYECFLKDLPGSFLMLAYPPTPYPLPPTTSQPIAGLLGVTWGSTGYYYYGASAYESRSLMAPYLLQFHAMKLCRTRGCTTYDLLGIEPPGAAMHPSAKGTSGAWAGITRFKKQFGGTVRTYPPEQMVVLRPVVKKVVEWKRRVLG